MRREVPHLCVARQGPQSPQQSSIIRRISRVVPSKEVEQISLMADPSNKPDGPSASLGGLYPNQDVPAFFETSYFGPQVAARMIDKVLPNCRLPSLLIGQTLTPTETNRSLILKYGICLAYFLEGNQWPIHLCKYLSFD